MNETAWFQDRSSEDGAGVVIDAYVEKEERRYWRNACLKVMAVILFFVGVGAALKAHAEPFAQASAGDVTITVYTEECTHQENVTNAPNRATWKEGDKVYDGCVGVIKQLGVAYFWFTDKTVAVVPLELFHKLTNA